MAYALIH